MSSQVTSKLERRVRAAVADEHPPAARGLGGSIAIPGDQAITAANGCERAMPIASAKVAPSRKAREHGPGAVDRDGLREAGDRALDPPGVGAVGEAGPLHLRAGYRRKGGSARRDASQVAPLEVGARRTIPRLSASASKCWIITGGPGRRRGAGRAAAGWSRSGGGDVGDGLVGEGEDSALGCRGLHGRSNCLHRLSESEEGGRQQHRFFRRLRAAVGFAVVIVARGEREGRQPGLAADGPAVRSWAQLVGRVERPELDLDLVAVRANTDEPQRGQKWRPA